MRRQPLLVLTASLVLLALEGLAIFLLPRPPSELAGFVRPGMPLGEVTTLFGKPPDLDAASDSGVSNADNITSDTTPTVTGSGAEAVQAADGVGAGEDSGAYAYQPGPLGHSAVSPALAAGLVLITCWTWAPPVIPSVPAVWLSRSSPWTPSQTWVA